VAESSANSPEILALSRDGGSRTGEPARTAQRPLVLPYLAFRHSTETDRYDVSLLGSATAGRGCRGASGGYQPDSSRVGSVLDAVPTWIWSMPAA